MEKRKYLALVWGVTVFFALIGWIALYAGETVAAVPLGLCPVLVLAGGTISTAGLIGCIAVAGILYGGLLWSIWAVSRRKRAGTVGVVVLLTIDAAANGIFTVASWWQLIAVALDVVLLVLCWGLYRAAGAQRKN